MIGISCGTITETPVSGQVSFLNGENMQDSTDTNVHVTSSQDALRPVTNDEKTWGWFGIFNVWANDVQSLFGYSLVASLFISFGVSGWTAFIALVLSGLFVMYMVNLSGAAGEKYGIPYPVFARASMGTAGSKLPAILRAVVAVFWYGVQVYFASTALALLIHALTGTSGGAEIMGLTAIGWLSFLIVWAIHIYVFWQGMGWVEKFLNFAGPFVYAVMIALVIVLWVKSDGQLLSSAQTIFANPEGTWGTELTGFVAIFGTMVAYFAAVMINFSDFSRYAKDKSAMTKGNLMGLPFNMILFSALALLTTAGAAVVYGEAIINPTEIVEKADSVLLSVIAAITFLAATMGINLVANFIPAVNGISNLAPSKISFRKAGLITSAFALIIGGFWVSTISQIGISGFVNTLGAMMAPLFGILVVDYYIVRKQQLNVKDLYDMTGGAYHYGNGWHDNALIAFGIAAIFSVATVWVPFLGQLAGYAWIIGAGLGGVIYHFRCK